MTLHFVNNSTDLFDIEVNQSEIRSVLVLADAEQPSKETINDITRWLIQTPDNPLKYACFAGKFSGVAHDECDDAFIAAQRDALTTWHDDEPIEDTAYFFCETVCYFKGSYLQVVFGESKNRYEEELLQAIKNGK